MVAANRLPTKITATTDRRKAIEGARYVISCVRVGGLEAYADDIRIPLKYGVDQCVGDTICAGGILYGQRNIPVILDFCRDIRELAAPGAKFLNYANPMAMNTWAAIEYGKVDTIGLCHGVQHGADQIAEVLGAETERARLCLLRHQPPDLVHRRARARPQDRQGRAGRGIRGASGLFQAGEAQDRRAEALRRLFDREQRPSVGVSAVVSQAAGRDRPLDRHVRVDPWRDRRLSPSLDRDPQLVRDGISEAARGRRPSRSIGRPLQRACQPHIEALETGRVYRGHFNVKNDGVITNLPPDAIIESPGFVDRFGINMVGRHHASEACAATCMASINVQRMSVHAAISGDLDLLKLAVLHDPLVGAICTPEEVWQMVDEMVVAQAAWLPQYAHAIDAARTG